MTYFKIKDGYKICSKCKVNKPVSAFFKDKQKASGIRPDCKECNMVKSSAWAAANKHRRKGYQIKSLYGLEESQYLEMVRKQSDRCAICDRPSSDFGRALCVDHEHATGKVRELLCPNCNSALGKFQDDIYLLQLAIEYLRRHKDEPKATSNQ